MPKSFSHTELNIVVIGAGGGIGRAFVDLLSPSDNVKTIHALSRLKMQLDDPKVKTGAINLTDENSIQTAAQQAAEDAPIDLVIVATGILHDENLQPEKALRDVNADNFVKNFAVNTIGPALVAKHFLKYFPRDRRAVFVALSARVGSIEDNESGGWYAYRASKAALNMVVKTASIEAGRKYKHAVIAALHPGTVDTKLSEPFQKNVEDDKLFTPRHSARHLLKVIDILTPDDTGKVFAWDGKEIPY